MKKLMLFIMAAFMAVGLVGTASAVDFTRVLSNPNTLQFFASPVAETGCTTYLLAGGSSDPLVGTGSGATLLAINPTTGASSFLVTSPSGVFTAGSTAFGTPVVLSGETIFVQVANLANTTGTSVAAINGTTGATYYTISIPQGFGGNFNIGGGFTGSTGFAAPLTLDPAGTTIYGVSGVSAAGTGVSIFAIRTSTQALSSFGTGVSNIWAAPLVSGNSIYILGNMNSGVSLIAFNKNTGVRAATASINGAAAATPFATPAISGNSIFVVNATGGLTAYNKNTLAAGAQDFIQYAVAANTAVTASPVTNGSFLVVTANDVATSQAGITVFNLSRPLAGSTGSSWWFTYTGATITATPAISNGVLYVAVNRTSQSGQIDRFNLSGHAGKLAQPDFTSITRDSRGLFLGFFDYSSPIIKGNTLQLVSNGGTGVAGSAAANTPVIYSFDLGANGNNFWRQFKADAERTGNNTASAAAVPAGDDDSGCFISTIK